MPDPVVLRRARLSDVPALARLLALTWRRTFAGLLQPRTIREVSRRWHNREHLAGQVRSRDCYFGVALRQRRLLGLTTVRRIGRGRLFMHRLYVRPGCQGLGLGERLLGAGWRAFPRARRMRLEVLADNGRAIAFYRKHGFRPAGRKQEPLDAEALSLVVMQAPRPRRQAHD